MILNLQRATELRICKWCGKYYKPNNHNQKYCSPTCGKHAQREQARIRQARYRDKHLIKQKLLGSSNLRQHPHPSFEREQELIWNERKRLGITKWQ